jgi:hypothetical protein
MHGKVGSVRQVAPDALLDGQPAAPPEQARIVAANQRM